MFDIVTSDPETRELIRIREAGIHDYNSDINSAERRGEKRGIAKGREEGELKGKKEMVLGLLKVGVSADIIAQTSGLSIEEIKSLGHKSPR
jgi:predicted transposase/invertase (TIGR01784 family)